VQVILPLPQELTKKFLGGEVGVNLGGQAVMADEALLISLAE
jgi:hypothetical protein